MKIEKIDNDISIVEYNNKQYVRKQFIYHYTWSGIKYFDFEINAPMFVINKHYDSDLEKEYNIELLNYKRKLKIDSI
ncbi:hypothetical protein M0Q50_07935 [bacterium]|jgi:hypothetical protein|nr:hypothetical protein [bacterium]